MAGPGAGERPQALEPAMSGVRCQAAWLLAALLACGAAHASGAAGAAPPAARPLIERTWVVAPHRVGDFVLHHARFDPDNRFAGVSLRYALTDHDETRIDLFVYPFGQSDPEAALDSGLRDFLATLEAAQEAGYYRGLSVAEAVEFDLENAAADGEGSLRSIAEAGLDGGKRKSRRGKRALAEEAEIARLLLAADASVDRRIHGRMLELGYEYPGDIEGEWFPMRSRGYLLYRHLHFFKGRISAAASRIDHERFAALADRAMRELVPAVQAYNVGGCGETTVHVDTSRPQREIQDMILRGMAAAHARLEAANCQAEPDEAKLASLSRDAELVLVEYEPDDWRTE